MFELLFKRFSAAAAPKSLFNFSWRTPLPRFTSFTQSQRKQKANRGGAREEVTLSHTHPHTHTQCICILLRGLSSIFNPLQTHLHALNSALGGRLSWRVRVGAWQHSRLSPLVGLSCAGASSCHFAFSNSNSHMLSVKNDLRWVQLPGVVPLYTPQRSPCTPS